MKSITKKAEELLKRRDLLKSSIIADENELEISLKTFKEKLETYRKEIEKAKNIAKIFFCYKFRLYNFLPIPYILQFYLVYSDNDLNSD